MLPMDMFNHMSLISLKLFKFKNSTFLNTQPYHLFKAVDHLIICRDLP